MKKVELLAPAGSYESVLAAINAGADAVYFGAELFSARAFADNLSEEKLILAIRKCHLYGVKTYLTLNILINPDEIESAIEMVTPLYYAGLDGVIVQDLGIVKIFKSVFPGLELHASTQMSIMNASGAEYLKEYGINRVVPARELTIDEILNIKKNVDIELECFIHGAMCYSYSGLCLMSSMIGARSGNRGKCAGTCRLPFSYSKVNDNKEQYPISMKDMCTINILPKLIDTGIDSFKIEGRMKSPAYVAGVTELYRKYINKYLKNPSEYSVDINDINKLKGLYIRTDISDGYYDGKKGSQLITFKAPGYSGNDDKYINELQNKYVHEPDRIEINEDLFFKAGEEACLSLYNDNYSITHVGNTVQPATNAPISSDRLRAQINKLGDSSFVAKETNIYSSDDGFMPMSEINELRRKAIFELEQQIFESNGFDYSNRRINELKFSLNSNNDIHNEKGLEIYISTIDHFEAIKDLHNKTIIFEHNLFDKLAFESIRNLSKDNEIIVSLPVIYRNINEKYFLKLIETIKKYTNNIIKGVLVHGIDELSLTQKKLPDYKISTDTTCYSFNEFGASFWAENKCVDTLTLPYETTLKQMHQICDKHYDKSVIKSVVVYGRIPMMVSHGCIKKTYNKCDGISDYDLNHTIIDRKASSFPVFTDCSICTNIIFNDRPLSLYNMIDKLKTVNCDKFRIDLTYETEYEARMIINAFDSKINSQKADNESELFMSKLEYTTAHIKRGV